MTLNQSLSGWFIECQCRLLLDSPKAVKHVSPPNQKVTEVNKLEVINEIGRKSDELNKLCYSLSSLGQILQSTCKLPHPAVKNICFRDLVKSATISKITDHFLDKGLECLFNKKKHRLIDGMKGPTVVIVGDIYLCIIFIFNTCLIYFNYNYFIYYSLLRRRRCYVVRDIKNDAGIVELAS